jgi:muramidase (phage lysozyme)/uncharacterized protein (DUF2345 family)
MPQDTRTKSKLGRPGPFLAEVTNHLDPTYMGGLEVSLIRGVPNLTGNKGDTYPVKYLNPFYGVTSPRFQGNNSSSFNDVQKSYGMWMIPPDIGTMVMVFFIDGDTNQGYWFGCVQDQFQNHMIPGIAASQEAFLSPEDERKYGTKYLPVAEFLKKTQTLSNPNPDKIKKPVHPFADRLLAQGLLLDTIRGVTSSSARREIPSQVFGISTPGPLDTRSGAKRGDIGYASKVQAPVSRLGGSSFVMDDGDVNGENELIRLRTRTGHQILMHNSQDLIYIANSKGTAWIEMTSNGKIDIYANDSVSIHSEADFNFRADRDVNIEAGRNINMASGGDYHLDTSGNFVLNVSRSGTITAANSLDIKTEGILHIESSSEAHLKGSKLLLGADGDLHVVSGGVMYQTSTGEFNVKAGGNYKETAPQIHMNGPAASAGTAATGAATATALPTLNLPNRSPSAGWTNGNFYATSGILSIMKRVPTHEPWDHHENINPTQFSADNTDSNASNTGIGKSPSVSWNTPPATQGEPPKATGNTEVDNVSAFLWMIRVCEGTSGSDGYRTMFTGKLFDVDDPTKTSTYQYADHPRIANTGGGITSTAAGAYQFLSKTWDNCKKILKLPDFSPTSQDKAAIFLLQGRKAYDDIKAGNFTAAVKKCNLEWASLPGSPYNQNPKGFNVALGLYKQGGGTFVA